MRDSLRARGLDYWRTASPMLSYALLGLIWLAVLQQFVGVMGPRLGHLGSSGVLVNDRPCGCPECDFSGFWPAGILARERLGAQIYKPDAFLDFRHHAFSAQAETVRWFYPPPTLLPSMAISYLPFEVAFVVWSLIFVSGTICLLRAASLPWIVTALAMLSPAALWNLELGQFGTILAGFFVCGLLLFEHAPWRGGALFGMLIVKPQYGLLVPVALLARGKWHGIAGCVLMVLAVLGLTTAILGWKIWPEYFSDGLAVSRQVLDAAPNRYNYEKFGVSVFWMLRSFGGGLGASYIGQAIVSLLVTCGAWMVWRDKKFGQIERMALTVFLSLLGTPYGYTDDMVGWSIALAALAQRRGWRIDLLDVLFWLWPMLCPVIVGKTGLLLTPVIVAIAIARTWQRAGMPVVHLPRGAAVLPRA